MWLWIIYCTLCAVRAVCSDIQAYLQHFFGLFDPCKLNSTTKLPADASFQPDKQCEPNLFTSCGVQCFFLTWFLYCMSRVSLLNFWLLTLDEAAAGLLHPRAAIDADRTACSPPGEGPAGFFHAWSQCCGVRCEFSMARDSDPSPCLVSSEQSCQAHFIFHFSSLCSKAVFSEEMMRISYITSARGKMQ